MRTIEQSTNFEEERIVKENELDGDSKFTMAIEFRGKSSRS
jgi:hypothetical protein